MQSHTENISARPFFTLLGSWQYGQDRGDMPPLPDEPQGNAEADTLASPPPPPLEAQIMQDSGGGDEDLPWLNAAKTCNFCCQAMT